MNGDWGLGIGPNPQSPIPIIILYNYIKMFCRIESIGDWGLGIGDWVQSPIPNPHYLFDILYFIIHIIEKLK